MRVMMRALRSILALGLTLLWMTGCNPWKPTPVDPTMWQNKQMRIGVAMTAPSPAASLKLGSQGLLDMAINEAMASDLDKHLATLRPVQVALVAAQFEERLRQIGFPTVHIDQPIDAAKLPERAETEPGFYDRSVEEIAARQGVDAILLISVSRWGTMRSYYGFIPTSDPTASFFVTGQLIRRDGRLLWDDRVTKVGAIEGEWDQAPDFPNITRALDAAQKDALASLNSDFFESAPPQLQAVSPPRSPSLLSPPPGPLPAAPPPDTSACEAARSYAERAAKATDEVRIQLQKSADRKAAQCRALGKEP